jgi:hypothetical protein
MDAGTLTIRTIFSQDRRLVVPLFQRPYVWSEELQWEALWDDIREVAERQERHAHVRPHFLGAIVLDQQALPLGRLETRLIIDGQQRLTTLQIVLEACADICKSLNLESHFKAFMKLTRNDDPMSTDPDEAFKVWPTQVDRPAFREVMKAGSPEEIGNGQKKSERRALRKHPIAAAYTYFHSEISGWLSESVDSMPERATALLETIRDGLRMVVIDLKEEDDAQLIFETLNARGTPLLPADLIKNHIFHELDKCKADIGSLYTKYWRSIDETAEYWRESLGIGHAKRARIDLFVFAWLSLKLQDEVPVAQLYGAFKDYLESPPSGGAAAVLQSISDHASIYRSLDDGSSGPVVEKFMKRLRELDITSVYPFILGLLSTLPEDDSQVPRILSDLESFLVRRMVCQLSTRGYNRVFTDLLKVLEGSPDGLAARTQAALMMGDAATNRWPDDNEFRAALIGLPLYRVLRRSRLRMILEALEDTSRHDKSEQIIIEKLTIEHLMPQEWAAHWPLPADSQRDVASIARESHIHRLGNLTLLTAKLNPSISNGPWPTKLQEILKFSALGLNRRLPATAWSENEIEGRSHELAGLAVSTWKHPSGQEVKK